MTTQKPKTNHPTPARAASFALALCLFLALFMGLWLALPTPVHAGYNSNAYTTLDTAISATPDSGTISVDAGTTSDSTSTLSLNIAKTVTLDLAALGGTPLPMTASTTLDGNSSGTGTTLRVVNGTLEFREAATIKGNLTHPRTRPRRRHRFQKRPYAGLHRRCHHHSEC